MCYLWDDMICTLWKVNFALWISWTLWADISLVSVAVFGLMFYQCLSLSVGWCFISVCHCLWADVLSVSVTVGWCFISVCHCLWADVLSVSVTVFAAGEEDEMREAGRSCGREIGHCGFAQLFRQVFPGPHSPRQFYVTVAWTVSVIVTWTLWQWHGLSMSRTHHDSGMDFCVWHFQWQYDTFSPWLTVTESMPLSVTVACISVSVTESDSGVDFCVHNFQWQWHEFLCPWLKVTVAWISVSTTFSDSGMDFCGHNFQRRWHGFLCPWLKVTVAWISVTESDSGMISVAMTWWQ